MREEPIRVLIVEDEAIVAADLEDQLEAAGHRVVGWTAEGEKVLEMVRRERPDVVLLDVRLSKGMDGVEVADGLRDDGIDLPLIFLTAYSDGLIRDRVAHLEPVRILYKPFGESELLRVLRAVVQE